MDRGGRGARVRPARRPADVAQRPQLGRNLDSTSAQAQSVLGWRPRPIEDSIADTADDILAHCGSDRALLDR